MKTVIITLDRNNRNSTSQITLSSQAIYSDGTPAKFGDGRDGEEQYVLSVIPSLLSVGVMAPFVCQSSGRKIMATLKSINSAGTLGDEALEFELSELLAE